MTTEREAYLDQLTESHRIRVVVKVHDRDETYLGSLEHHIVGGQIDVDTERDVERSAQVILADENNRLPFDNQDHRGLGLYADRFIGIEYGVFVDQIQRWVFEPVFFGPMTRYERNVGQVKLWCEDKSSLLQPPVVWGRFLRNAGIEWLEGETDTNLGEAAELIRTILRATGETDRNMVFGSFDRFRLPKSFRLPKEPESLWAVLKRIVRAANALHHSVEFRLFYDGAGRVRVENMAHSRFVFSDGGQRGTLLSRPIVSYDLESFRNTVVVRYGERGASIARSLPNHHPLSAQSLSRNGKPRYVTEIVDNSNVRGRDAAKDLGDMMLRRLSAETVEATFDCLPIPHVIPGSRCKLRAEGDEMVFHLNRFSLPLRATDAMSVGYLRRMRSGPTRPIHTVVHVHAADEDKVAVGGVNP